MIRFLAGFALAPLAVYGWILWTERVSRDFTPREAVVIAISTIVVPLLAAIAAAALVHIRKPRRWLTSGASGMKRAFLMGLLAGGLAMAAAPFAIYFANRPSESELGDLDPDMDAEHFPDAAVLAAVSFPPALLAVWLMPRRRPGYCIRCGYDIRYSLDAGRCPECGEPITGGVRSTPAPQP